MTVRKPNIIIIYADDLGFGDIGCYGATQIPTPNLDKLCSQGIKFYNAYATAATCTPSRYSLLTGVYPWRNPKAAILAGDAPLIIPKDSPTLPSMLQDAGYETAIVGKWHLGMGSKSKALDWNHRIEGTPNDVGFDKSFIMAATNDRVPCVYLRNRKVENLDPADPISVSYSLRNPYPESPTGRKNRDQLQMDYSHGHDGTIVNGVSRIGFMTGGKEALWDDETMAETFVNEAVEFISEERDKPFFLYYALHQPHVPRIPSPRFKGSTKLGPRGDVIAELDHCVGEIMDHLDKLGIRDQTMVIFSSDNGPVLDDGYKDRAAELSENHKAAGPLRGGKYSLFDGGTRVPFIVSWPGMIKAGESKSLLSQMDLYASFAALTGESLPEDLNLDSINMLPALLDSKAPGRDELITEGTQGQTVLREGDWIYIPPHIGPGIYYNTRMESGNSLCHQLYNVTMDEGQRSNMARKYPKITRKMNKKLKHLKKNGISDIK